MSWRGAFFGAVIGLLLTRTVWGAAMGALVGYLIEHSLGFGTASEAWRSPHADAAHSISIPGQFFRTTFELMGHVAKSDGRVSEAEIGAAQRLMPELQLANPAIGIPIVCSSAGKS